MRQMMKKCDRPQKTRKKSDHKSRPLSMATLTDGIESTLDDGMYAAAVC
jgi:hypothetical protein